MRALSASPCHVLWLLATLTMMSRPWHVPLSASVLGRVRGSGLIADTNVPRGYDDGLVSLAFAAAGHGTQPGLGPAPQMAVRACSNSPAHP